MKRFLILCKECDIIYLTPTTRKHAEYIMRVHKKLYNDEYSKHKLKLIPANELNSEDKRLVK